jgi:biotin synthase-like enzyme
MELRDAANILTVFIGIESPNAESLRETKKYQNIRRGGTIVDRVRKVRDSRLEVGCGMIVGFNHDDARVFKAQREPMHQTDIVHAMVGMLSAIPKAPPYARVKTKVTSISTAHRHSARTLFRSA